MKSRCLNEKSTNYHNYGGRGIEVCEQWVNSFKCFMKWAQVNGYDDSLQLDRIDNDGDYTPQNCRFVTRTDNNRNTRHVVLTISSVKRIRSMYPQKQITERDARDAAVEFNCSTQAIRGVVTGRNWKNI
jgi:hypothetical protein